MIKTTIRYCFFIASCSVLTLTYADFYTGVTLGFLSGYEMFINNKWSNRCELEFFREPGLTIDEFSAKSDDTAGNIGVNTNENKNLIRWSIKTGLNTAATQKLSLQLSYAYSQFNSVSTKG